MTDYKPIYRPKPIAIVIGLGFWLMLGGFAWAVYHVVAG